MFVNWYLRRPEIQLLWRIKGNDTQLGTFSELLEHGVDFTSLVKHETDDIDKHSPPIANGHCKTDNNVVSKPNNKEMISNGDIPNDDDLSTKKTRKGIVMHLSISRV